MDNINNIGSSNIQIKEKNSNEKYMRVQINPQMPKVKIHLRTPRGGGVPPPLDFGPPVRIFRKYFSWVCFRGQGIQR